MKSFLLPTLTTIITFIILALLIKYRLRKSQGNDKTNITAYLNREANANFTRRKDIDNLPYLQIPFDELPLDITLKDENMQSKILEYQKIFRELSNKKLLNLIGITNLELKETYGPANLEALSVIDSNYSLYIRTLSLYAQAIFMEYPAEAIQISEYCIRIGTDISSTYVFLANHYLSMGKTEQFKQLYSFIPQPDSISGKMITQKLDDLIAPQNADL